MHMAALQYVIGFSFEGRRSPTDTMCQIDFTERIVVSCDLADHYIAWVSMTLERELFKPCPSVMLISRLLVGVGVARYRGS